MLIIMATSGVALLLISAAFIIYEVGAFRESMKTDLSTQAAIMGDIATPALDFDKYKDAEEILGALSNKQHVVSACIFSFYSSTFSAGEIAGPGLLAGQLKPVANADPLAAYVYARLQPQTQRELTNYDGTHGVELRQALAEDLNQIIQGGAIYDAQRFGRVKLSPETSRLLAQNPRGTDLVRLNRMLLQDAYPRELENIFARYPKYISRDQLPARPEAAGARFVAGGFLPWTGRLAIFQDVVDNGEVVGSIYLESDLLEMRERLWRYGGIVVLFIFAISLVTYLLSAVLQRIISQPVSHLAETARAVSTGKNYSIRAVKRSQDELGQLMDGFNEMLAQIQQRDAALQQAHDKLERRVAERTYDLQLEVGERRRTQEALQQQLARISLLNQITHGISERQDLPSIFQVVLGQLEEHLPVDMGGVYLLEPPGGFLTVAALQSKDRRLSSLRGLVPGGTMSLEQTGFDLCQAGQVVYLENTARARGEVAPKLAAAGLMSGVAVPLLVEGKLFGILMVARSAPQAFSADDCEFLRMLSEHVALAAHQARLHTELEAAYNDLRHSQQAVMQQDRLRALGQMASGIAHDVNNALSPVVGFAGLILNQEPNLSASSKKHLNYIKTAGEDVAHIVARLREFYRPRDQRDPLFPVSLNKLALQVIEMTRPRWRDIPQGRGITVAMQTRLADGLPEVVGIESEIREALTNLILNAVDAMPQGGKLMVRTRLGGLAAEGPVLLEVIDSGVGMSEETLKRALEPFFSTKGKRGTGMGLPMVYGVMERHGGKIDIQSERGKGTTVSLSFAVRPATAPEAGPTPAVAPPPLHLLCIDDEPMVRELLTALLQGEGHRVQAADGGQTGLDLFHQAAERGRPFDVVITDLGMPNLDGREVAKILHHESPATPVIMLTGWGAFMKSDGDIPVGVDLILSKPPRAGELREALAKVMTKKTATPRATQV